MDGECALCGRANGAATEVYCHDCESEHRVCRECVPDARAEYGLELIPDGLELIPAAA